MKMDTTIISIKTHVGNDNCQPQMMTSLEIAELTGKQHKDVMKAIRNMEPAWVKVTGLKFQLLQKRHIAAEVSRNIIFLSRIFALSEIMIIFAVRT